MNDDASAELIIVLGAGIEHGADIVAFSADGQTRIDGVVPAATNLLFSWPAPTGFWLQQNSNLATTNWITCTNAPVVMGGSNQVSMPQPYGSAFYRLMSQ